MEQPLGGEPSDSSKSSSRSLRSISFLAAMACSLPARARKTLSTASERRASAMRCLPLGPLVLANQFLTVRSFASVHLATLLTA